MTDRPGWIQHLINRSSASHTMQSVFLHNSFNAAVAELAATQPNGHEDLRQAALEEIVSDEPSQVALALIFLRVVGLPVDRSLIETFCEHSSELVKRAAKLCRYELNQRVPRA